jgi:hypothetical protein
VRPLFSAPSHIHCVASIRPYLITAYTLISLLDDFQARSPDELSLAKGDRVQLVERDDDFGDGWYLGKHLLNGNTGLFPEGKRHKPTIPIWLN